MSGAKKAVPQAARLYAYIIADVTDTLRERIDTYGFEPKWDQRGYFWRHPKTNMLIEIIPWDKLITDAERRNEVFFRAIDSPTGRY